MGTLLVKTNLREKMNAFHYYRRLGERLVREHLELVEEMAIDFEAGVLHHEMARKYFPNMYIRDPEQARHLVQAALRAFMNTEKRIKIARAHIIESLVEASEKRRFSYEGKQRETPYGRMSEKNYYLLARAYGVCDDEVIDTANKIWKKDRPPRKPGNVRRARYKWRRR